MLRINCFIAVALFAILVFQHTSLNSLVAQDGIPETPAGKSLSALIDAVNGDEESRTAFLKTGFAKVDEETLKQRKMQTDQVKSQLGGFTFKKVVSSTDNQISAVCETSTGPNCRADDHGDRRSAVQNQIRCS